MAVEELQTRGIVNEIGIVRDEDQFRSFNLTIEILVETKNKLTYKQGEKLLEQFRKDYLGKNVKLELVAVPCPICGKAFNSELGTRQHMRMVHTKEEVKKGEKELDKAKKQGKI
ncbi:MAG: C2H2-type zinc finger protein [Candidatus Bathyarchaeia archaeon]